MVTQWWKNEARFVTACRKLIADDGYMLSSLKRATNTSCTAAGVE